MRIALLALLVAGCGASTPPTRDESHEPRADERTERAVEGEPPGAGEQRAERVDPDALLARAARGEIQVFEEQREPTSDGAVSAVQAGDLYRGRVLSFFRRGWALPESIDPDLAADLSTIVEVEMGETLQIVSFRIRRSSGHAEFDESIARQLSRLRDSDQRLPPPPEEIAAQYVGRTLAVRFHGRDAR
jgi:hypothetical protein